MDASFRWDLSEPFGTSPGNFFVIYQGEVSSGTVIVTFIGGPMPICDPPGVCIVDGTQVGFTITNIDTADASRYSIEVDPASGAPDEDNNAVLYVYRT